MEVGDRCRFVFGTAVGDHSLKLETAKFVRGEKFKPCDARTLVVTKCPPKEGEEITYRVELCVENVHGVEAGGYRPEVQSACLVVLAVPELFGDM